MLGPGVGGSELIIIALVALIVVGPKDLPLLLRKVGQFVSRARKMANEFRASFDDMARQSELDDLRKEVEALRSGQMDAFAKDTNKAWQDMDRDIRGAQVTPKQVTQVPPMTEPAAPVEPAPKDPVAAPAAEATPAPKPRKTRSKAPAK